MTNASYPLESLFGRVLSPFEQFLRRTTAGGIVLIGATLVALVVATMVGEDAVQRFWARGLALEVPELFTLELSWQHWINDGLMTFFFLLVGLELKREILVGELASLKQAWLPVIAAAGGMLMPALFFAAFNFGGPTQQGWGIPMATDIAFAVGILVLLAWRIPRNLIVFLTALAIADDLGAVLVIALFYSNSLNMHGLLYAAALLGILGLFNRGGVRSPLPYAICGIFLWYAVHASGLHATLAGILLAAAIPARPAFSPAQFEARIDELRAAFRADREDASTPDDPLTNARVSKISEAMESSAVAVQSPLQRMEHSLAPWVTFIVIPLFALANAGIDLRHIAWGEVLQSDLTAGVVAGLVLGKFIGVTGFSWIAVRLGWARLPSGVGWRHLTGAAWLSGIGFTMSLFIAQLAFGHQPLVEQAKIGILLGSALAGGIGLVWLWLAGGRRAPDSAAH